MSHVNFLPWIGKYYQAGLGEIGHKVLILGESHYCEDLGSGRCKGCSLQNCIVLGNSRADYEEQTREYIQECLYKNTGKPNQQTVLRFEKIVLGKKPTQYEREAFWNSVVFYNYIQKALPKVKGKRTDITEVDLVGAEPAFKEILDTFMPDKVIAWGYRLFENLLPAWGGTLSTIKLPTGEETDVWTYTVKGKEIPVLRMVHPSYFPEMQNNWEKWHRICREFLK